MIASRGSFRYAYAVGYLNKALGENFQAVAPSFRSIGVDGALLSQIKVEGVEESKSDYYVTIQMLDDMGVAVGFYDWWHGGRAPHKTDGWYEGNDLIDADNDVELAKGQGLWVTAVEGAYLVSSGEVLEEDVLVELEENFQMVANPFPAATGLSKIKIDGVEESKSDYYVTIQMLDDMGVAVGFYDWWHGGRAPHKTDGWYEGNDLIDADNDVEIEAGQALWITAVEGATITFECPWIATEE